MTSALEKTYRWGTVASQFGAAAYSCHLLSKTIPGSNRNHLIVVALINIFIQSLVGITLGHATTILNKKAGYITAGGRCTNRRYYDLTSSLILVSYILSPLLFKVGPFHRKLPHYSELLACLTLSRWTFYSVDHLSKTIWPLAPKQVGS